MLRWLATVWIAVCMACLSACGGGGGGGSTPPAATFTPGTVSVNVSANTSATLTVRASVANPSVFSSTVFVLIEDPRGMLTGSISLSRLDSSTFAATIHTSPSLPEGTHSGSWTVRLCRDSQCSSEYPGSPLSLPYSITVAPAPLSATTSAATAVTGFQGTALSSEVQVTVAGPRGSWTATTSAPWLQIVNGSGTNGGRFSVRFSTAGLAAGSYTNSVRVRSADGQVVDLPFSLTVLPVQFQLTSGTPAFTAINGAPIPAQSLSFDMNNGVSRTWSGSSATSWLLATPLSGVTPATVSVQPDPSRAALPSGQHTADIVLTSPGIPNRTVTTTLDLTAATLSSATSALTFGGAKGRDLVSAQSLAFALNTGANQWAWSLDSLPAWMSASANTGTVSQTGSSVNLTPNLAAVTPGSTSGTVTIRARVNGDSLQLPITVNLNADQRRLLSSQWGIALTDAPTGSTLTRTVEITDNFGADVPWTATSSQSWLTVTAAGRTGTSLAVVANPTTLATNTLHRARITVSPTVAGMQPAVIEVGLWKGSGTSTAITSLATAYKQIVADKIRPYVYAHNGGTSIDVYNVYQANKIATINGVGAALAGMTLTPDGQRLLVADTANASLATIDLETLTPGRTWSLVSAVSSNTSILAIRPNGVDIVLVGTGAAYLEGRHLANTPISGTLSASADGRSVYTQDSGLSPASVASYDVDYSAMAGGVLMVTPLGTASFINGASNGQDIAVTPSGSALYLASGVPYLCSRVDPNALVFIGSLPGGDPYPNNVEVTQDGRVLCGIAGANSTYDFWVHASSGGLLQGFKVAGYSKTMLTGQMVVSPDGLVAVALTDDPVIAFVPIGTP